jgi:tight adherence protein B
MTMTPGLLTLFSFLAGVLAVAGIYSLVSDLYFRDRDRVGRRVDEEFRKRQRDKIRKTALFKDLGQAAAFIQSEEGARTLRQRFIAMVEQSGLNVTPERLLVLMFGAGGGSGAIAFLVRWNLLVGGVVALVGGALPFLYVLYKRNSRLEKLLSQLPDAFDLMARVIRAGQTMSQAMLAVADEFDQPVAGEFAYCYEQQNLGLSPEIALRDLARRTGLLEIKIFVLGLVVQQQSGGNLAELLDKLSHVIRERFRMRGKIQALTAENRMQAIVLLILPVALMLIMMLMSSFYAEALFQHAYLILAMLIAEGIGALWIRQIVNFDF